MFNRIKEKINMLRKLHDMVFDLNIYFDYENVTLLLAAKILEEW